MFNMISEKLQNPTIIDGFPMDCMLLLPTLEALVDYWGKSISQHHCSGINDDFSTSAPQSCDLPPSTATI